MTVKVVDVHLQLAYVLVLYFPNLQIDHDEASQKAVVQHQIRIEMLVIERQPHLPLHEREPFA
jgi:hypothetical protein